MSFWGHIPFNSYCRTMSGKGWLRLFSGEGKSTSQTGFDWINSFGSELVQCCFQYWYFLYSQGRAENCFKFIVVFCVGSCFMLCLNNFKWFYYLQFTIFIYLCVFIYLFVSIYFINIYIFIFMFLEFISWAFRLY